MSQTKWEAICLDTIKVAKAAGHFILSEQMKVKQEDIEHKKLNNLVSYVDKNAEIQIIEGLKKIIPDSTFLAEEETTQQSEGEYQWIIDPLDGTTNFLHHLPTFAVSIALVYQSKLVVGVVYEINKDECFYAWKDGGAYLNGDSIKVSPTKELKESLLVTGFPYYDFSIIDQYIVFLKYLMLNTRGIRRFGAAAVDLCYVACGRFDAYFEQSLSPWDVAAGALIVQESGGHICDFNGGDNYIHGREILASNDALYPTILDLTKKYLGS